MKIKTAKKRLFEGLPVRDAKNSLTITVTKADVKGSRKKDPAACAAAVAGQRILKKDVRVYLTRTYVKEKKGWVRYVTPAATSREIISFDRGSAFAPGTYKLNPVSPSQRVGVHRGPSTHPPDPAAAKRPVHITADVRERASY